MITLAQNQTFRARLNAATVDRSTRLLERGWIPDQLVRLSIRRLLRDRLLAETRSSAEARREYLQTFIEQLKGSPIALSTREANAQHYEVPARFFELALGKRLKYSSGLWLKDCSTLDDAEEAMLALTVQRACLEDGQSILELGCGWGSLTQYMAERFPNSRIVAVSNSSSQRAFIEERLRRQGSTNVRIVTADMNEFDPGTTFDRVVSVEMFEHMRNYQTLLARVASWMKPEALLFVHIFTHRQFSYPFEVRDAGDWMARHFFTGGIMPAADLLLHFQKDVALASRWTHSGTHYQKTARAWLDNTDAHRAEILELFEATYGATLLKHQRKTEALRWLIRWRLFFMACEELWGYRAGKGGGSPITSFRRGFQ